MLPVNSLIAKTQCEVQCGKPELSALSLCSFTVYDFLAEMRNGIFGTYVNILSPAEHTAQMHFVSLAMLLLHSRLLGRRSSESRM